MKKINNIFFATLFLLSSSIQAATLEGRVVGVSDGDTITILATTNTQHKIRLAGIDAPEKKQPFGNVSKKSLSDLVFGKQVAVDYSKQDRYGRFVGKVLIDGSDVNLEQVKHGFAWFYKKYQNELILDDRLDYLHAHEAAGVARVGLWVDRNPVPPWEFRKSKKTQTTEVTATIIKQPNQLVVFNKSVVTINNNIKSNTDHCYSLATDEEVLGCLN